MASQLHHTYTCRIYQADQLQDFNPNQPFSSAGGYADLYRASHPEDGELALKRPRWGTDDHTDVSSHAISTHYNCLTALLSSG